MKVSTAFFSVLVAAPSAMGDTLTLITPDTDLVEHQVGTGYHFELEIKHDVFFSDDEEAFISNSFVEAYNEIHNPTDSVAVSAEVETETHTMKTGDGLSIPGHSFTQGSLDKSLGRPPPNRPGRWAQYFHTGFMDYRIHLRWLGCRMCWPDPYRRAATGVVAGEKLGNSNDWAGLFCAKLKDGPFDIFNTVHNCQITIEPPTAVTAVDVSTEAGDDDDIVEHNIDAGYHFEVEVERYATFSDEEEDFIADAFVASYNKYHDSKKDFISDLTIVSEKATVKEMQSPKLRGAPSSLEKELGRYWQRGFRSGLIEYGAGVVWMGCRKCWPDMWRRVLGDGESTDAGWAEHFCSILQDGPHDVLNTAKNCTIELSKQKVTEIETFSN